MMLLFCLYKRVVNMSLIQLVLGFLVLGSACGLAIDDHPPIFRWGYEVVGVKGYGKPGRAY